MAWGSLLTLSTFTEDSAGAGEFSSYIALKPGERAHVFIERLDSNPTDPWIVQIFGSPDATLAPDLPLISYKIAIADTKKDFMVVGPVNFRFFIQNADGSPVDVVSADVSYKLDGVSN